MKKNKLNAVVLLIAGVIMAKGQVGIGTSSPDPSANLHVAPRNSSNQNKGTLLGTMTTQNRNSIAQPATGLMIYNTTDNCLQINNGTPASPKWECLSEQPEAFGSMNFGRYKPFYWGMTSGTIPASQSGVPPYSPTNTRLYGAYTANGNFASNDIFRVDVARINGDSYAPILYNISGEAININYNTVTYGNPTFRTNVLLNDKQGSLVDGNFTTYFVEAQNIYVTLNYPDKWTQRKFLIGFNVFKEDYSSTISSGGNGSGKINQSMISYIFEFK
ncbi:hypothetical protein [Chryseobacterium sp. Bi04]|uniref:hypothetical protein n=1 Tax=Chryseobacterium sp. Bi04 TaxID=2822345 RepID=UPI001D1F93E7|nr:hypothetical protein [Chryseobacterium sp. Bi04]CAH0205765.1 hypothetical protein SRABI04_02098 [Chryseobacterium sp. Bi04]